MQDRRPAPDTDRPVEKVRPEEIARLIENRQPVVFLDYDATLTPIVARPELAIMSDELRAAVLRLAGHCTVAIVSGRDRGEVHQPGRSHGARTRHGVKSTQSTTLARVGPNRCL